MQSSVVKWDDLRVFLEVARQGSVHSAAKRLKLDHSTVCRRIDKLETHLSLKLLDRTRRGVVVRNEAKSLLKHIREMENHASYFEDVVTRDAAEARQTVRIATMEGIASCYLARRLPALSQFSTKVNIELVSIPQTVDLSRKEADMFISFYNPNSRGLRSALFGKFSLFLYCSPDYLRKHGTPHNLEQLQSHTYVGYIDDLLAIHAVRWLDEVVLSPKMSFQSNSILAQRNAAAEGMGIVLLPTFVAAGVSGLQRILPDQISARREIWVSVRTEQSHMARIKTVTQFIKHIVNADADFLMGKTERLDNS
ncbi:MAG: LysR family transcriptional regulator [Pseudolabrys sp.]